MRSGVPVGGLGDVGVELEGQAGGRVAEAVLDHPRVRDAWLAEHPEANGPQASFDLGDLLDRLRPAAGWQLSPEPNTAGPDRGAEVAGPDLGVDIGP